MINASQEDTGCTPLIAAAHQGHTEIVITLLEQGAKPDVVDDNLFTALHWAAYNGHFSTVKAFINAKVNTNILDKKDKPPVYYAINKQYNDIAINLLKAGEDKDMYYIDKEGRSYLHYAAHFNNLEIVNYFLLTTNIDKNIIDTGGLTALNWAALKGNIEIVKALLEVNVELNSCDKKTGRNALHWASYKGYTEIVEVLLKAGAKTDVKDKDGCTAYDIAAYFKDSKMLAVFDKYIATNLNEIAHVPKTHFLTRLQQRSFNPKKNKLIKKSGEDVFYRKKKTNGSSSNSSSHIKKGVHC